MSDEAKKLVPLDDDGEIADKELRQEIIEYDMRARNFFGTVIRAQAEAKAQGGPSATSSALKNIGARLVQKRSELLVEMRGMEGYGWEGEGFSDEDLAATRDWLWHRAVTIYGGSEEIQNNILAKRVLGMRDHQ